MTRTSEGILAHSDYHAARRRSSARAASTRRPPDVDGALDEEFLPMHRRSHRSAGRAARGTEDDQPLIDEHHEINLDEVLRQNILTNLPLQPLCEADCPGLCPDLRRAARRCARDASERRRRPTNRPSPSTLRARLRD